MSLSGVHHPDLAARVLSQAERQPSLYGGIDFDRMPYRLVTQPDVESTLPAWVAERAPLLQDAEMVELMSTTTMLGDVVADPYAALLGEFSFASLTDMLRRACREGIDAVPEAPPELRVFIAAMEHTPDWLDMELVREGARQARIPWAFFAPFLIRGTFVATFVNTYSALPMALTGALGGKMAAKRVNETAAFFGLSTTPGALERHGRGFEAAAMVRLMHSMVRVNVLRRSGGWDSEVFGIPIPQVDQMPAGLINCYLLAVTALRRGRQDFSPSERAVVEFSRYRCHLLGLPEELLPTTPADTVRLMHTRAALLRHDYDDATCGALVRATMAAELRAEDTVRERASEAVERSFSKMFFVRTFANGDRAAAAGMGVVLTASDLARIAVTAPFIVGRFAVLMLANRVPFLRDRIDAYAIRTLRRRLRTWGRPQFESDGSRYAPVAKV